jgi:hypothetical protein
LQLQISAFWVLLQKFCALADPLPFPEKYTYFVVVSLKIIFVKFLGNTSVYIYIYIYILHKLHNKPHKTTNNERSVYYEIIHISSFSMLCGVRRYWGVNFHNLKIVFFQ